MRARASSASTPIGATRDTRSGGLGVDPDRSDRVHALRRAPRRPRSERPVARARGELVACEWPARWTWGGGLGIDPDRSDRCTSSGELGVDEERGSGLAVTLSRGSTAGARVAHHRRTDATLTGCVRVAPTRPVNRIDPSPGPSAHHADAATRRVGRDGGLHWGQHAARGKGRDGTMGRLERREMGSGHSPQLIARQRRDLISQRFDPGGVHLEQGPATAADAPDETGAEEDLDVV